MEDEMLFISFNHQFALKIRLQFSKKYYSKMLLLSVSKIYTVFIQLFVKYLEPLFISNFEASRLELSLLQKSPFTTPFAKMLNYPNSLFLSSYDQMCQNHKV